MRILISTMLEDLHAVAVATGLEQAGHEVVRLHHADFPTRQRVNLEFGRDVAHMTLSGAALPACELGSFDVVWNRRHMAARPEERVAVEDRDFVRRETREASKALWRLTGEHAFWINPVHAADRAQSKPLQLTLAQRVGLSVPETLISNDPERIRAFVRRHAGHCVYKPFLYGDWTEAGGMQLLYTSAVDETQLPDDTLLQACPGIFQRRVPKLYEVRATFMGAHCSAIRIDSQRTEHGQVDWRLAQQLENLPSEPIDLPSAVYIACRALMAQLGVVFGCFDFIVSTEGAWVFLEVNEAGQFLFLELWCPVLPVLDMFCRFLVSRDADFRYAPSAHPVCFKTVLDSGVIERVNAAEREDHVCTLDARAMPAPPLAPAVEAMPA